MPFDDLGLYDKAERMKTQRYSSPPPKMPEISAKDTAAFLLVTACAVVAMATIYRYSDELLLFAARQVSIWGAQALVTVGVVGLAVGLFKLKYAKPYIYASLELAFAAVTAWNSAEVIESDPLNIGAIAAAAYLAVRGLDNLKRAHEVKRQNALEHRQALQSSDSAPVASPA